MEKSLDQMTPEELGRLFPIQIVDYDPDWPAVYCKEKEAIQNEIGNKNVISIEHIGSTAIPGLCAKPTIDILLVIPDDADLEEIIHDLRTIGYIYNKKPENPPPGMMFVKGYTPEGFKGQAYHVHIRYSAYKDEIYFRDYLINHPEAASEYANLKIKLGRAYEFNREEYTNGKTDFCKRVTMLAKRQLEKICE